MRYFIDVLLDIGLKFAEEACPIHAPWEAVYLKIY